MAEEYWGLILVQRNTIVWRCYIQYQINCDGVQPSVVLTEALPNQGSRLWGYLEGGTYQRLHPKESSYITILYACR